MDLNNREVATLAWLALFTLFAMLTAKSSVASVLRAALNKHILGSFLLLATYTCGLASLGRLLHVWNIELVKETIVWFTGSAIVLLFQLNKAMKDIDFFRKAATKTLGVTVAIEFFLSIDTAVLPLPAELILQPIVATILGLSVYSSHKGREDVKSLTDAVLKSIGSFLIVYAVFKIVQDFDKIDWPTEGLKFVLPMWMTVGALPLIYLYATYAAYELLFIRMKFQTTSSKHLRQLKRSALRLGYRPSLVSGFKGSWTSAFVNAESRTERQELVRRYKESLGKRVGQEADESSSG